MAEPTPDPALAVPAPAWEDTPTVRADPWQALRRYTPARIALGRAGNSQPTRALLAFGLAQAQARDAVHEPSHAASLLAAVRDEGWPALHVHSAAADRVQYLRRPDLGRRLDQAGRRVLQEWAAGAGRSATDPGAAGAHAAAPGAAPDLVLVLADGLSSQAGARHALPLLRLLVPALAGWTLGPIVVADQARVALGDEIGQLLRTRMVAVLIGERPGLSAPDSLGIYLTHHPCPGRSDAERNCVSNIRPDGLGYAAAAARLQFLLQGALRLGRTGVDLKDESPALAPAALAPPAR